MKNNKEKFIALCKQWIKRDGLQDLLNWLEETDFYEAPASTRFHSMFEGGLCSHSINVFNRMKYECENEGLFEYKTADETQRLMESIAIISLFHDICKTNFYKLSTRNVKDEYGNWTKVPYYIIENHGILVGHGYKSARLVNKYIDITDEEYMAIVHHMGVESDWNIAEVSECFRKNKLALLLHIADTKAAYIDEGIE